MLASKRVDLPEMDVIYDGKHEPVISRALVKDGESVKAGTILKVGEDFLTVEKAAETDTPYAVALSDATGKDGKEYVDIILHGTVKKEKVLLGEEEATAEVISKLNAIGIYAL